MFKVFKCSMCQIINSIETIFTYIRVSQIRNTNFCIVHYGGCWLSALIIEWNYIEIISTHQVLINWTLGTYLNWSLFKKCMTIYFLELRENLTDIIGTQIVYFPWFDYGPNKKFFDKSFLTKLILVFLSNTLINPRFSHMNPESYRVITYKKNL